MRMFLKGPVILAAVSWAMPAAGEPIQPIEGRLRERASADSPQKEYSEHHIRLAAGRQYRISVCSFEFDVVIRLLRRGSADVIAENDDSDLFGGTDASLDYTPAQTADYALRVSPNLLTSATLDASSLGTYFINVDPGPLPLAVGLPQKRA